MTTLATCLTLTPRRTLRYLARQRGLTLRHNAPHSQLVTTLAAALLDPTPLTTLAPAEVGLLRWLLAEGGSVPLVEAVARYGPLRPYRPWRKDNPPDIGLPGVAPTERLAYLGLVFVVPDPDPRKGPSALVLPDEYHPFLAPAPPVSQPAPPVLPAAPAVPALLTDLALLLSLFHRETLRPQQHHWLPAAALRDLHARLTQPDPTPQPRHELHDTPRLRLLHFLAEAATLCALTPAGFTVTDVGWRWLALPPTEQLLTLWHAFTSAPAPLWARFRLPAAPVVLPPLVRALSYAPESFALPDFARTLAQAEPPLRDLVLEWEDEADCTAQAAALLLPLLRETLPALGLLALDGDLAILTPVARWLLEIAPSPPFPAPAPFHLAADGILTVPAALPAPVLVRVEAIATWQGTQAGTRTYTLTEASLQRTLARGIPLPDTLRLLQQHSQGGLPPKLRQTLEAWAAAYRPLHLSRVTLLEGDPDQLRALSQSPRLRPHLLRPLSPRALLVDESHLPALTRQLARRHLPHTPLPAPDPVPAPNEAHALQLLVAAHVYAGLSAWIELPHPLPAATRAALEASLDPATRHAAHTLAHQTLAALARALDGDAPAPFPGDGLPITHTRPLVEQAIAEQRELHLTYFSHVRGSLTQRTVEPLLLDERRTAPTLRAFCHLAQAERTFRLDRIRAISLGDTIRFPF